jgi:hypothetical protein
MLTLAYRWLLALIVLPILFHWLLPAYGQPLTGVADLAATTPEIPCGRRLHTHGDADGAGCAWYAVPTVALR